MLEFEWIQAADRNSRRLMVMLHGLGDSLEGFRWMPPVLQLPWLHFALVNAPDEYYGGYSWFDFPNNPEPGVRRSQQLLTELLEEFRGRGFAPEQTTLGGFSQGCLMAIEMGMRHPHRLAGIVGISGRASDPSQLIAEQSSVAKQQRFFITHGTLDQVIPFSEAHDHVRELQAAGMNIEWHELVKPHTIAGEEELALIREFVRRGYE